MDGWVKIGTELDTKNFDAQIREVESRLEEIEHKLKQADMGFEVGDTLKLESQYEKLSQKLSTLKTKQLELTKTDFSSVGKSINNVGGKVDSVVKKIGRWAMAVFGIRSAYMLVRKAMSTIAGYNDQIKTDIEYIGFALATTLEPIIKWLMQGVYTILNYVNYLAKAWFGVNIFANASVDAFKKANKQAKELQKSTQGFDEMNIIGGGNAGVGTPSMNLSAPQDVPIPSWLQWIVDNKELVIGGLIGIAGGLLALELGFKGIKALGIGLILAGIAILIQGIVNFIKDPSWDNFLTILQGIALIVAGIAILMGGWTVALIALGVAIVTCLIKNWDKVKEILGVVGKWIYDKVIKPVGDFFVGLWNGIKSIFSNVGNFFKGVFNTIKDIFKNIGQTIGDVIGSAFKTAVNAVLSLADTIINAPIKAINALIGVINKVPGINLGTLNTIKIPRLKTGGIVNYPGRGVYSNGTIRGEAGAEGVIPLTDSQAMSTLGEAIGRYITINANITNSMDGKVIGREVKRIQGQQDFLMNR